MTNDRRKVKLSREKLRKIIIIAVIAIAALTGLALWLRSRVASQFGRQNDTEISSAAVTRGSISTSVYGSGRLSDDDVETLEIPSGVELTDIPVSAGDKVEAGDVLAEVDLGTVLAAMSDVNDEIASVDTKLASAANTSTAGYISSSVSGRVKKVYAASGDNVAALMYKYGALALLSLDGYMAVDIDADGLTEGDALSAVTASALDATVSDVTGSTATVLVSDASVLYGESVTVCSADGSELGTGEAYIHDELKIVGYTGTVAYVSVAEGSAVGAGATLMTLSDTATGAEYNELLSQRSELEGTLKTLINIYNEGALCAESSGTVIAVNAETADEKKSASSASTVSTDSTGTSTAEDETQSITLSPDKTMSMSVTVDETEILSVSIGQSAEVSVDAIDGETFTGTVTGIDRAGTSSSGVTVYTAEVSIPKADGMLSGMSASATISIEGVEDALLIPADAVNRSSSGYYVYTSCDEESGTLGGMVEVTVGITNSSYAEILSGLSEGDTVYYIEKEDNSFSFGMPGGDFGGGGMPSGDFPGGGGGGGMPGGGMPGGGGPGMG